MQKLSEEHIWEVLDGTASSDIQAQHDLLLANDSDYRQQFESCAYLHQSLLGLPLECPSLRFTENVMDKISMPPSIARTMDKTPYIFLAAMVAVVTFIIALLPQTPETPVPTPILDTITEGVISELSNPILYYIFMAVNVAMFFIFLDYKVFKPYFDRRMRA
jgi:hypothetical protein